MALKHPEYASGISDAELIKEALEFCDGELDGYEGMEYDDDSEVCCQRSNTIIRELVRRVELHSSDQNNANSLSAEGKYTSLAPYTSKHTPGPWGIEDLGHIFSASGVYICAPAEPDDFPCIGQGIFVTEGMQDECKSNSHLIAAAPELLEALIAIVKDVEKSPNDPCGYAEDAPIIMTAKAAIAKAEGLKS